MAVLSARRFITRQVAEHDDAPDARWQQLIMRVGFIGTGVLMLNLAFRSWQMGQVGSRHIAKSITAMINNLSSAIQHHSTHSNNPIETKKKCVKQIHRLLGRLIE